MPQLEDLARTLFTALDARDYDRLEELVADDCDVVVPGFRGRGPQAYIDWARPFCDAFPDLNHTVGALAEGGDTVAFELRVAGTHTEPLRTPAGDVPATGRAVDFHAGDVWQVNDGRIVALHVYFDQMELLGQLGLLPEPAATS
jgi:steroid delta-isomerase-like uncharacterized protein